LALTKKQLQGVIITFISILVGVVLIASLGNEVDSKTRGTFTETDEKITLINGTAVNLANDWVTGVTTVKADNGTNLTLSTSQYNVGNLNSDDLATITLTDATYDGNTSYVTYDAQNNDYVRDNTSRVLIRLVPLFFAIAIVLVGLKYGTNMLDGIIK